MIFKPHLFKIMNLVLFLGVPHFIVEWRLKNFYFFIDKNKKSP
jgi:hypothetical protein